MIHRIRELAELVRAGVVVVDHDLNFITGICDRVYVLDQGKVIAVGKGKVRDDGKVTPLDVSAGDLILFGKYSGQEIKLDAEEYLIMREDEVLGIIEEKTAEKTAKKK